MPEYTPSTYNFYSDKYDNPTAQPKSTQDFGTPQFMATSSLSPFPFGQQSEQSTDYRQRFGDYLGGLETPEDTRGRFENRYGYQDKLAEYQGSSSALANLGASIQAAPDQISARTAGTMTTQSQLANIQNKEVGDLLNTYNQLGGINAQQGQNLAMIEQNMNDASSLEMARQQIQMTPWLQEYDDINIMQAKQYAGWTFAGQLELDTLLANQSAGLGWSNAEAERANELAIAEKGFENALDQIKLSGTTDIDVSKQTGATAKNFAEYLDSSWESMIGV